MTHVANYLIYAQIYFTLTKMGMKRRILPKLPKAKIIYDNLDLFVMQ